MANGISSIKASKILCKFLEDSTVFIVDSSGGSRARLASILIDLGASSSRIETFMNVDFARERFESKKPAIVFSDHKVGKGSGFQLLQDLKKNHPELKKTLFVMVSSNSSQSVVARAAEEDIDAFILKPYTIDLVVRTLATAVTDKLHPSTYMVTIEKGKELMMQSKFEEAMTLFDAAMKMSDTPTLAHFYKGHTQYLMERMSSAQDQFETGLEYNKIHYKCLVGLYDILFEQKLFEDAYDVVRTIAEYFPANPERLAKILWLAIVTQHYTDVEEYYQFFKDIEDRPDELVRHVCAAMLICGKYFLKTSMKSKAFDLFEKVGATAVHHPMFLRILIEYMTEFDMKDHYEHFMKRFSTDMYECNDYKVASFLAKHHQMKPLEVLKTGEEFVRNDIQSSAVYFVMIHSLLKLGRRDDATNVRTTAFELFPEKTSLFSAIKMM